MTLSTFNILSLETMPEEGADMFSGAGGTSTALMEVASELGIYLRLVALNHDYWAIATHKTNHPSATMFI
jgi:site-specific DNA-cytosine methylase